MKTKVNIICQRLPVLDVKPENHDINIAEWPNIPKFLFH